LTLLAFKNLKNNVITHMWINDWLCST